LKYASSVVFFSFLLIGCVDTVASLKNIYATAVLSDNKIRDVVEKKGKECLASAKLTIKKVEDEAPARALFDTCTREVFDKATKAGELITAIKKEDKEIALRMVEDKKYQPDLTHLQKLTTELESITNTIK
jgi:hypothetical protein